MPCEYEKHNLMPLTAFFCCSAQPACCSFLNVLVVCKYHLRFLGPFGIITNRYKCIASLSDVTCIFCLLCEYANIEREYQTNLTYVIPAGCSEFFRSQQVRPTLLYQGGRVYRGSQAAAGVHDWAHCQSVSETTDHGPIT